MKNSTHHESRSQRERSFISCESTEIIQTSTMTKDTTPQSLVDILTLNRINVLDQDNNQVLLSTFWKSSPVVFILLRHFGCIACRAQVDQLWKKRSALEKNGTKIIFIGNGSPEMIKVFKEELKIPEAPIFTDPTLEVFDACGLNRGLKYLVNAKTLLQGIKLYSDGYTQGSQNKETGFHTQMGGIVAIKPPGQVTYHFASEFLGHFDEDSKWS